MLESPKEIIDWLVWACGSLVAYFVHDTRKKMTDTATEVATLQNTLAEAKTNIATEKARREMQDITLARIELSINQGFQRLYDKLETKEDKR